MKSFRQLQSRLPDDFLERLYKQFTPGQAEKILAGFMVKRPVTLRVNTLKTDVRTVMQVFRRDNIKFDRVLWYNDALVITNRREKDLESHPLYEEGHIYLQSLSSMLPPLVLNPSPGANVLDLTAAPGGKTAQMAALMENKGFILANDINTIRAERLNYNIVKQGVKITEIFVDDGKNLAERFREYFDYVLLDAPCSGEGLFSVENPRTYRHWSVKSIKKLAREQKKLLRTALWALKAGGALVYSTCTLSEEENQQVVEWALEQYPSAIKPEKISLLPGTEAEIVNSNFLRVFPSQLMEGFFVAKIRKIHPFNNAS